MAQISFWGIQHGLGGTSNTAALAAMIGMEFQLRTLVSQPQWSDMTLEGCFRKSINQYMHKDFLNMTGGGIDALERLVRSNKVNRESIKNNALLIERDRLDLLSGTEKLERSQFENLSEIINLIYHKAQEYYDLVLLDVHSGSNSSVTNNILNNSDLIVVCLNQNLRVLEKYFSEKEQLPPALKEKPHLLVLGQYDLNSKYKIKNIANKYSYKGKILTVPYNTAFMDHFNDGDVKGFFYKNRNVTKNQDNYRFIQEVRNAAITILTEIGVNVKIKHIERGVS
ncbi:hypothetical protein P4K96_22790 [Bacillus cereus]|uniref:hypothetical protein n=1 Tax=Paenibacillus melissococcoides TaxID=2912268 RepID=UPI0021C34917|nr:hypothetical protein [Paenibacillus melissococcoides]MEB9896273.1 hypothetical protein [Bacillus cereus]CAH8721299.1 hypothetical protein HTL2_006289 [Paenibacillus melissococcoides]